MKKLVTLMVLATVAAHGAQAVQLACRDQQAKKYAFKQVDVPNKPEQMKFEAQLAKNIVATYTDTLRTDHRNCKLSIAVDGKVVKEAEQLGFKADGLDYHHQHLNLHVLAIIDAYDQISFECEAVADSE